MRREVPSHSIGLTSPPPVTYNTGYTYYQDGSLQTLTYPSGDVLTYTVGGAGRATLLSDSSNNYVGCPSGFSTGCTSYAPNGSLAGMYNGTTSAFAGIYNRNVYNNRLQPIFLGAWTGSFGEGNGANMALSLCYDFHLGVAITTGTEQPCSLSAHTTGDNGNVFQILNEVDSTRSAAFTYDPLNRISQANTTNTTSSNCWGEAYTIDAWGNMTNIAAAPGIGGSCFTENLNNPVTTANQLTGYCYDTAGNPLLYGACPSGSFTPTYDYDAENRLYNPQAEYTYFYDADGVRIRKAASATVGTMYWPDPSGEYLMETNGSGTINEEYIYFNGARIARVDRPSGTVHYYRSNHLGTASVITDASGNIEQQTDYYPFGGVAYTSGSDPNHYKFTGKERDAESGLDEFGARYYGSSLGRFMTPDWATTPIDVPYADFGNPQSLNLYSYVKNNPTTMGDPDGHDGGPLDVLIGFAQSLFNNTAVPVSHAVNAIANLSRPADEQSAGMAPLAPENDVQAGAQQGMNRGIAMAGVFFGDELAGAGSRVEATVEGAAAESAANGAEASGEAAGKATQLQINKATGDAFRDEVAGSLKAAGRDVQTEVTKQTPFGARRVDIEVSHNGKTLGGVETKTGNSPYKPSQRAKDTYLKQKGYRVNVVRKPKDQ